MKVTSTLKATAMLLLLALGATVSAEAQDLRGTLKKVKDSGSISIGYRDSSPPFSFVPPTPPAAGAPQAIGYSVDLCLRIVDSIQKRLNMGSLQVKWVKVTPETRIASVMNGTVDLECGSSSNTFTRQEQVDFSNLTFIDGGGLMAKVGSPIRQFSDLAGKKVGVIPGTTTEKALNEAFRKERVTAQIVPVKEHAEGRTALEQGTIDAYASDRALLIGLILTAQDPSQYGLPDVLLSYEPYGFMLRRDDSAFRLEVNRALAEVYRSGDIVGIYQKWFGAFGKPGQLLLAMYLLQTLPE